MGIRKHIWHLEKPSEKSEGEPEEEAPAEIPAADVGEDPAADAGGGGDPTLLAVPPGSRNAPRLTPGAKGKVYHPVRSDSRKDSGPRTRNYQAQYNSEKRGSSNRAKFPGSEIASIPSIAKGIYEEEVSIYNLKESNEERKLFEVNDSLHNLITDLENKNKLITEQKNED